MQYKICPIQIIFVFVMREGKNQQYLHYGQIIRIHGNQEAKRGLIGAKGFTDIDAKYLIFDKFKNIEFYRQGLFQILPRGVFETHDELAKTLNEKAKIVGGEKDEEKKREHELEQLSLILRAEAEKEQYETVAKTRFGDFIHFGQDVIFKHVDSGSYLSGSVRCSDGGLGAFKVELSKSFSSMLVFKLLPFRSYEKQGDKIKLQSPLRIKNLENRCYLSREESEDEIKILNSYKEENKGRQSVIINKFKGKRQNIVTTYSQTETWLIHLHQSSETLDDVQTIRNHDIITFKHTQKGGYLAVGPGKQTDSMMSSQKGGIVGFSSINIKDKDKYPILRELEDNEYPCFSCLWEIQFLPTTKISPPTNQEESNRKEVSYCLRDLLTGSFLVVGDSKQLKIYNAKGNDKNKLENQSLVKIGNLKDQELDVAEYFDELPPDKKLIYMKQLPYKTRRLEAKGNNETEHGFRISKVDDETKKDVLFVLSTYQVLEQFANILKNPVKDIESDVKSKKLEVVDNTVKKLIAYVKKCQFHQIESEILPKKKYQMILKDLNICNIIFSILDNMGEKIKNELFKNYKKEGEISKSIFNNCYLLVFQIIKDNPTTKLYVSEKWLEIILKNAIEIEEKTTHIALNEILNNNETVVNKFLNETEINKILNIFRLKPPHEKFLNIFRSSCICGKTPIIINQKEVLRRFFKTLSRDVTFAFVPKLLGQNKFKVEIKSCINKKDERIRSIEELYNISSNLDFQETWRYFLSYLNLLADICYGRNYEAKRFVEELLTSQLTSEMKQLFFKAEQIKIDDKSNQSLYILCTILEDEGVKTLKGDGKDCLQAVLRLINYAFVDTANQNPILRLSRIRNYEQINKQTEINSTPKTQQNKQIDTVIKFLKSEIKNFVSFQECDNKEKQFLLIVLDLLKSTLLSGYWRKYEELLQLLIPLLSILKNNKTDILETDIENIQKISDNIKEQKIKKFKEESTKCIPSVNLIIQCKQLVCDLIEIILDFRTDIRVTHCTLIFKELLNNKSRKHIDSERVVFDGDSDQESIFSFDDEDTKPKGVDGLYEPITWRNKLKEIMKQRDELSQIVNNMNLNSIMAGLSIYKNPQLIAKSLTIQYRIHERLKEIMKQFSGIGLIVSGQTQSLIKQIQSKRNIFAVLQDQNLLHDNKQNLKVTEALKILAWLAHSVKKNFQVNNPQKYMKLQEQDFKMFGVFCERDLLHVLHQRLIRCSDIHPAVLKFLVLCREDISEYVPLTHQILKSIYCFLTMLAKQSLEMKQEIVEWMPIFKQHLKWDIGALQLLYEMYSNNKTHLYNEVQIEQTASLISQLIESHETNTFYKSKLMNFFHCLIYFNQDVILFNQSVILSKLQDSKKKCIYYKDDKNEHCLNIANISEEIRQFEEKHPFPLSNFGSKIPFKGFVQQDGLELDLSPQLTYFITVFDVFSSLVQGPNLVNIGKCRQVHSYNMLLEILKTSKICYPLKKNVRAYINRLYYVQSDYENISQYVIKTQIPLFIQDLDIFIMIRIGEPNLTNIYFKNPIRFKYFQSDFYLYLEQILVSLQEIMHNEDFKASIDQVLNKNYQKGYYYLHYYIIRIFERLRYLKNEYHEHRFLHNFISTLTFKMKNEYLDKFAAFNASIFDKNQGGGTHNPPGVDNKDGFKNDFIVEAVVQSNTLKEKRMKELEKRSRKLIKLLRMGQIYEDYLNNKPGLRTNFPLTFSLPEVDKVEQQIVVNQNNKQALVKKLLRLIYSKKEHDDEDVNEFNNGKIKRIKNLLQKREFITFLSEQFKAGCFDLYELDKNSMHQYGLQFLSLREYIITIVKINTQHPQSLSCELKQFIFRILRRFIEQKNVGWSDERKMVDEWETDDWKDYKEDINKRQKFLNEAEIPQLIIQSLKHRQDLELNNEILLFAIAFILGGNSECQKSILQKLKEDKKNEVFTNIHELITNICRTLYAQYDYRKPITKTRESFNVRLIDDKNYFNTKFGVVERKNTIELPNTNQKKQKALSIKVFKRVFRFLQLLCENNNIDNKNYMREQWDVEGKPKINSINMIEVATFETRGLFKIMNREIAKIPLNVLDFINEINQIPCSMNQKTLCRTTFFEDFCYMANFLSDENNQKERHFMKIEDGLTEPYLDSLYQIYNKCINIVICVLQGNDEQIYKELSTKLQLKFLEDVISKNLQELGIKTKDDIHQIADSKQNKIFPRPFVNAINVMVILRKIREWDSNCKLSKTYEQLLQNKEKKELHSTLEEYMLSIQIKSEDLNAVDSKENNEKKTQTVYFPKHPILTYLSGQTRDMIMITVGRQTQRQKLVTLLDQKDDIFREIQHNFRISKEEKWFGFTYGPEQTQDLLNASLLVSMLISIIWVFTTDVIIEYQTIIYTSDYKGIITILSLLQTFLTALYVGGYVNSKAFERQQRKKSDDDEEDLGESVWIKSLLTVLDNVFSIPISILRKQKYISKFFDSILILFKFNQKQFFVLIIFALISLMGTFYQTKYFTLHLIFIFTRIELLENVFNAIVTRFNQLFYVSLLGIVFVYAFCIVTYRTYGPDLHAEEEEQCDSMIQCLIDVYISGTINGGLQKFLPVRFAYDLVYFMFFGLLFENIISGIVIDTFAELRTQRNQINTDKKNKCYICGIERATLEKSNQKFEEHINKHLLWNYIFYLYCLKKKDTNDYSGLEYQISNKNDNGKEKDISWIPIYYENEQDFEKQIEGVKEGVQKVQEIADRKQEEVQKRQDEIAARAIGTNSGSINK